MRLGYLFALKNYPDDVMVLYAEGFSVSRYLVDQSDRPTFLRLTLTEFKLRLIDANSHNLLHLSRADLVQAMDPQLVAESETAYLNATFHFVLLEGPRT